MLTSRWPANAALTSRTVTTLATRLPSDASSGNAAIEKTRSSNRNTCEAPSRIRAAPPTRSQTFSLVPAIRRPRRFTISTSEPESTCSSRSAKPMSEAQMAIASRVPSSRCSGTPTESVMLRSASIATPLLALPAAIMAAIASSLAAAVGSNAGTDEYSTSRDRDTMSSRVTSRLRCSVARVRRAASETSPRSPLTMASRRLPSWATTGVTSRIRCSPVSTILPQRARLPLISVTSSWWRSSSSR